jgi:rubredoxin
VVNFIDVGSHILIIGEVLNSDLLSGEEPLTYDYYREKYKMLAPKNAPTYVEKEKLQNDKVTDSVIKPEQKDEIRAEKTEADLSAYICNICGFQYDPAEGDPAMGIPPGTSFEDLPEDYRCPICNASKDYFSKNE